MGSPFGISTSKIVKEADWSEGGDRWSDESRILLKPQLSGAPEDFKLVLQPCPNHDPVTRQCMDYWLPIEGDDRSVVHILLSCLTVIYILVLAWDKTHLSYIIFRCKHMRQNHQIHRSSRTLGSSQTLPACTSHHHRRHRSAMAAWHRSRIPSHILPSLPLHHHHRPRHPHAESSTSTTSWNQTLKDDGKATGLGIITSQQSYDLRTAPSWR